MVGNKAQLNILYKQRNKKIYQIMKKNKKKSKKIKIIKLRSYLVRYQTKQLRKDFS
jgi:hypothetical protein